MSITITMPALSPTMTEGKLAKWMVKEGDKVSPGDIIAEIETDKATMEVEAVDEGTVARILVAEGTEGVAVNAPIAMLAEEGEDVGAAAKASQAKAPPAKVAEEKPADIKAPPPAAKPAAAQAAPAAAAARDGGRIFVSPLAKRMAEQAGIDLAALAGSGPNGRIVKADIDAALAGGAPKAAPRPAAAAPAAAPA
ncbi:biotin/lipoyl-containing protein, partial [Desertibaculum subflavum]|uniref:biotin/lipoyl-containing protein n=1 Tax=Desertibaculum subflavum TaxID=2268458 RepID=UPI000E66F168